MEYQPKDAIQNGKSYIQTEKVAAKKLPQYFTAVCATIGGMATGTVMGWSSPAGPRLKDGEYGFDVGVDEEAWISSVVAVGAALSCFPAGYIMEKFGRKLGMMIGVLPFTIGWLLIILAQNVGMLLAGRVFTGIGAGIYSVIVPTYNNEICQDDVRGPIGTLFQIMFNVGILVAYVVGGFAKVYIMSIVCGTIPIIFTMTLFIMPETPYYLLTANKHDSAKESMAKLRGSRYDVNPELDKMQLAIDEERNSSGSLFKSFTNRAAILALVISLGIMVFSQFSGMNAVLFNATNIFISAGANMKPEVSTIIIGVIQLVATFISTLTINRLGRKALLLIAALVMAICDTLLGVYFYLNENHPDTAKDITWLPLVSVCVFLIALSIGHGPISWMLPGEVCASNIRGFVYSTAIFTDWMLAFVVTSTFVSMQNGLGEGGAFWLFAGVTYVSIFFLYFVVPETKGKTLDEVQQILKGKSKNTTVYPRDGE